MELLHGFFAELRRLARRWVFSPRWHPRTDPAPDGVRLWATDGKEVWEIWGDGRPISPYATRVLYWAVKHIPDPPPPAGRLRKILDSMKKE